MKREKKESAPRRCVRCGYEYDPRRGDAAGGVPPGVPFERLPAHWRCPVCGARRSQFPPR